MTSRAGSCVTSQSMPVLRPISNFGCPCANDETHSSQGFQGFGFGDGGFQMSFGIGAFPFGIFATAFNINDGRPPPGIYLRYKCILQLYVSSSISTLTE